MSPEKVAALMQHLSATVAQLDETQADQVLSNEASLSIVIKPIRGESKAQIKRQQMNARLSLASIVDQLNILSTREDGCALLEGLTRFDLQELAKFVCIAVDGSMNKEKLVERIVERKIGLRLRQNAFAEVMSAA
jgi:hypothetical protein